MRQHRLTFRYLIEIIIINFSIVIFNQLIVQTEPGFYGWNLNPFWIPVLLFSLRYGFAAGCFSGFLASISYLALCYIAKDQGQFILDRYLFEEPDFYVLPSAFLTVGGLIGWMISSREDLAASYQTERDVLAQAEEPLKNEIHTLHDINLALEKKIVTQMSTLVTMYEGSRLLENQNVDEIMGSITGFFSKVLGVEEASLYRMENGSLAFAQSYSVVNVSPEATTPVGTTDDFAMEMIQQAALRRKIVSLRDYVKEGRLSEYHGDCLVAGPLFDGESGDVIAVYSVQKIPLGEVNSSFVNALNFLLAWASRAIGKARQVQELRENAIIDEVLNIFTRAYFLRRCEEEFSRSKKYYLPLSFARVHVAGVESLPEQRRINWLTAVVRILKASFSQTNVIGLYEADQPVLGVLMVTCSPEQAEAMVQSARRSYIELGLGGDALLDIQLTHFTPKMISFDEMRRLASP